MNAFLKGIIEGLEKAYRDISQIDIENNNVEVLGIKVMLLKKIQHWRQISLLRDCTAEELDKLKGITDLDELDLKLTEMGKVYMDDKTRKHLEKDLLNAPTNTSNIC